MATGINGTPASHVLADMIEAKLDALILQLKAKIGSGNAPAGAVWKMVGVAVNELVLEAQRALGALGPEKKKAVTDAVLSFVAVALTAMKIPFGWAILPVLKLVIPVIVDGLIEAAVDTLGKYAVDSFNPPDLPTVPFVPRAD